MVQMIYRFADCELDLGLFELRREGHVIPTEPQVFDVLAYLVTHHQRVVTKNELVEHIWHDRFISEAALNSRLMAARRAIGDDGHDQRLIRTLHGRGYRFVAAVQSQGSTRDAKYARAEGSDDLEPTLKDGMSASAADLSGQRIGFCTSPDGLRLAYAVVGEGPPLVKAPNWLSHLEFEWRSPIWRHWLKELASNRTLIRYDQRGCGLSDWNVGDLSLQAHVRDLEAVTDALGLQRFSLLGVSQGGAFAVDYAVRHPERVSRLILYGAYAKGYRKRDLSRAELEERQAIITLTKQGWGRDNPAYRQLFASFFIPEATREQMDWFNELCRISASPENAARLMAANAEIDVDDLLPQLTVPTLVIHARSDARVPFEEGRRMASRIPGARFVPLESANHILLESEPAWGLFCQEVEAFLRS